MYHNTLLHDTLFVVLTCYTFINHPALGIKSSLSAVKSNWKNSSYCTCSCYSPQPYWDLCLLPNFCATFFFFIIPVLSKIMKTKYIYKK